jgi:oxalate decarboxylase/phosphoglucose isomerase-like protein (cupin superfamily)
MVFDLVKKEITVGYVPISNPHYIENACDTDLVFLDMFKSSNLTRESCTMDGIKWELEDSGSSDGR